MKRGVYTWTADMAPLGEAVVAIGVFDGVHRGHQALLRAAVTDARKKGVTSVAVTFDRDPDQVVTPESAAPQLLTLEDKCRFILECGVRVVLVVPFDEEIAATPPEPFLDEVLGAVFEVRSVHVGRDFRFGADASGDLDTLYVWGIANQAEVTAHQLVEHDGAPITSTRIRTLVTSGDVASATELLGRFPSTTGVVRVGRREGAGLGFPTANVDPVPLAAVPADGVYAGFTVLADGSSWPSAISVGTPPTFPEARDHLESHLIGFEGDLYGATVSLEYATRLRDLEPFDSLEALTAAIAADVTAAQAALEKLATSGGGRVYPAAFEGATSALLGIEALMTDDELVEDPAALAAAERSAAQYDPDEMYELTDDTWVELLGPQQLSGFWRTAGFSASLVTMPLQAADIPYVWDPYPPEQMPSFRPAYGAFDRGFSLMVPQGRLAEANRAVKPTIEDFELEQQAAALEGTGPASTVGQEGVPPAADAFDFDKQTRVRRRKSAMWVIIGIFFFADAVMLLFMLFDRLGWLE